MPGLERSPGEGNGNPFQYSCLENSMDRGAWRATVYGVTKCQSRLSPTSFAFILGPECHAYSTSFEGQGGRIIHFLITLLALTWLPGGRPARRRLQEIRSLGPLSRGSTMGCLPCLLPTSHCQGSVLLAFQRLIVKCSANAVSYEPISQSRAWILRERVKITVVSSDGSRRNCVLLVVLFAGRGFRGTGMGKCTSWPFWK